MSSSDLVNSHQSSTRCRFISCSFSAIRRPRPRQKRAAISASGAGAPNDNVTLYAKDLNMMSYEMMHYQCSIKFLSMAIEITSNLPRGHASLADQIRRASMSIPLSIGEGAGKRTKADCRKYFDIARGSAMECAATIDVCRVMELISAEKQQSSKELLHRIVAMLTKLARS